MGWRIAHSFDPYLWRISEGLGIRWFAVPAVAGFLLSFLVLRRSVKRGELRRLSARDLEIYILALIAGVFIGARLFHVFLFQFGSFGLDPQVWIAFWRGGLSTQGGIVGGALATWGFCRRKDVGFYEITDRLALVLALALGFSKVGDFINGTGVGTPYEGPLCVDYSQSEFMSDPPVGCRHPIQLYEAMKDWLVFAVLVSLRRISRPPPGVVSWLFVFAYGLGRLSLMSLRDESALLLGWSASQWLSGAMTVVGGAMLARLYRGEEPKLAD